MNTLLTASARSHGPVRAAVFAASLAVLACFGAAVTLDGNALEAAETTTATVAG